MSASFYATQALHGLVYGMLLFLVASGLTLVFGMMRILNMAHASFYMAGAYIGYSVAQAAGNFWLALIIAPATVGLLGIFIEVFLLRRMFGNGHVYELLLTFGLFYIITEAIVWHWGSYAYSLQPPVILSGSVPLFGASYPVYRLFVLAMSVVVCAGLATVLLFSRAGIIIRATVSDDAMVSALGINTSRVRYAVFGAGAALAAFAGIIAVPFLQAEPSMGASILIDSFVVVVIGGFGSLAGALLAALLIGEIQSFGILFLPDLAIIFQFLLMALVLMFRPSGLFGEPQ